MESMSTHDDYEALAAAAEAGELKPVLGTALRGTEAAAAGRAALLAATGADTIEEAARLAIGRPRIGEDAPSSTVWRVRAPSELDERVRRLAEREGLKPSQLVRKAVAEYAAAHPA